jgi:hypothetical protein
VEKWILFLGKFTSSCCLLGPTLIHCLQDLGLWNVLSRMHF